MTGEGQSDLPGTRGQRPAASSQQQGGAEEGLRQIMQAKEHRVRHKIQDRQENWAVWQSGWEGEKERGRSVPESSRTKATGGAWDGVGSKTGSLDLAAR
jgi:hypothetical protein